MSAPRTESVFLADATATEQAGCALLERVAHDAVVYLIGNLGAGKTTLVRGLLRALGYSGAVKSPTYTLLEPYEIAQRQVYHFDLYRISDPGELYLIGIDELLAAPALKLIEWPEQGDGALAPPDVTIHLQVEDSGRRMDTHWHGHA